MCNFTGKASELQFGWLSEIGECFKMDRYCGIFRKNLSWINVIQIGVGWPFSNFRSVLTPDIDITVSVSL
jgi:hypothetical protein